MTDMITIDRSEYEGLLADRELLGDIQAYDRAMTDYDPDDMIPERFVTRILDGESPLAVMREWRGMNQSGLARAAGVNRVSVADIEAGRSTGSVATLKRLAATLRVDLDDIV